MTIRHTVLLARDLTDVSIPKSSKSTLSADWSGLSVAETLPGGQPLPEKVGFPRG